MTEEQKTILIERYLKGELPDAERQELERMIENDAEFAEDVSVMRLMLTTLEDRDQVKFHQQITAAWDAGNDDEKEEPEIDTPAGDRTLRAGWSRRRWLLAAALLLAAVAAGVWQYYQIQPVPPIVNQQETPQDPPPVAPVPQDSVEKPAPPVRPQAQNTPKKPNPQYIAMAKTYYASAPDFSNLRKADGSIPVDSLPVLQRAERAFFDKQHEKVIQLLARPDANVRESAIYLRGHAHFNAGHYEAAARDFQTIVQLQNYYADDAEWYLLLSNLVLYGPKSDIVRGQLEKITSDAEHPKFDKAKKLRDQINR